MLIIFLLTFLTFFSCGTSIRDDVNAMPKSFNTLRDYGKSDDDKVLENAMKLDDSIDVKKLKKTLKKQDTIINDLISKMKMRSYTLYLLAIKYKEAKLYYEALEYFEQAIKANPNKDNLYYEAGFMKVNIANTLADKDKIEEIRQEAMIYFNQALNIDPNNTDALFALATMHSYFYSEHDEAMLLMSRYSKLTNPTADSLFLQAYIAAGLGKYNTAAEYYEQVDKLKNIDTATKQQAQENRNNLLSRVVGND